MLKYEFNKSEHLHLLGGKPLSGTSSIVGVLSKPLSYWASGKACEVMGWLNPKKFNQLDRDKKAKEIHEEIKKMPLEDYVKILDKAYHAHAKNLKETAKAGTNLHEELEHFVKSQMGKVPERADYDSKIIPFIDWSKKNVKRFLASECHCYSEKLWVGGITDAVAEMNDGSYAIIDFKSAKSAYPTHFVQAELYAMQIEENGMFSEDGEHSKKLDKPISKLIIVAFGAEVVMPEVRENLEDWKKGAEAAVVLYRLLGIEKQN